MLQALQRLTRNFLGSGRPPARPYEHPPYEQWIRAQDGEFDWWRSVSSDGYGGQNPEQFIREGQRDWLLSQLAFLEKPLDSWKEKTVVEIGSGPAGFVEYIEADRRIAVEPLIERYRETFPHLAESEVHYISSPGEEASLPPEVADLVICFNVLDHTYDPSSVLKQLSRAAKPGADLLFQVNVYKTQAEVDAKHGLHAELHPHSFFPGTVRELLTANGFRIWKESCSEAPNPSGEYYFICAGTKI